MPRMLNFEFFARHIQNFKLYFGEISQAYTTTALLAD